MMLSMRAGDRFSWGVQLWRSVPKQSRPVILSLLFVVPFFSTCLSQTKTAPKTQPPMAIAVEETLAHGHDAQLPPHISHLLGIGSGEEPVSVKQFVRMGDVVRGFEVSVEDHNDIVIFTEDRPTSESMFYLTSERGSVRKVVSIVGGVGQDRAPTAADQKAFAEEKAFWIDKLLPHPPPIPHH